LKASSKRRNRPRGDPNVPGTQQKTRVFSEGEGAKNFTARKQRKIRLLGLRGVDLLKRRRKGKREKESGKGRRSGVVLVKLRRSRRVFYPHRGCERPKGGKGQLEGGKEEVQALAKETQE